MDVWVVAAAAGAGYIAQHWKNLSRSKREFSDSSTGPPSFVRTDSLPDVQQVLDKNCSFIGETPRNRLGEGAYTDRLAFNDAEVASTSSLAGENPRMMYDSDTCIFTSRLRSDGEPQGDQCGRMGGNVNVPGDESSLLPSTTELGFSYSLARKKSNLRCRRNGAHLIKPLNSLESCLMAQLYKECGEVEDYTFSSNSSPWTPAVRPFVVTDGCKVISRASSNSLTTQSGAEHNKLQDNFSQLDTVFGVPQLPSVGPMVLQRKSKVKDHYGRFGDSSKTNTGRRKSLQGSSHAAFLFCLGISVGIVSSFWSNRKEADKLSELLKQSENLVQDLQEELEMKDSLTVKELAAEGYDSQDTLNNSSKNGALQAFSPQRKLDKPTTYYDEENHSQKTEEESFSKIEAELEAELERLELNINSSKLEGKLAELIENDPDFVPDLAEGELRTELFGREARAQPFADRDGSGTATPNSVNYAVSPTELSLRLHKVLQSQLEERVKELEMALDKSESKARYLEAELISSWRESTNSEAESSSTHGSPVTKDARRIQDQPVVINLSGEALDAYNEAYDELTRVNESEEDIAVAIASGVKNNHHQESFRPRDWNENGKMDDESEDGDDEMEKLLIRHIVEKARKGSPAVLDVQRVLFSLDDNKH